MARSSIVSTLSVLFFKLLGTLLGLISAVAISYFFGAGAMADAYLMARRAVSNIATMAERLFHVMFVPDIVRLSQDKGIAAVRADTRRWERRCYLLVGGLCLLGAIFAPVLVGWLAPGFDPETAELAALILRILLITLPVSVATGVTGATLNALRVFTAPVVARLSQRGFVVMALLCVPFGADLVFVACAIVAGTAVMFWAFRRATRAAWARAETGAANPKALPINKWSRNAAVLTATAYAMICSFMDTYFASLAGLGAVTIFALAQRVTSAGAGQITNSVLPVYYTNLAEAAARGDTRELTREISRALAAALFFLAPVTGILLVLGEAMAGLLLGNGAFDAQATRSAGQIVMLLAVVNLLYAPAAVLGNALYASPGNHHLKIIGVAAIIALAVRLAAMIWGVEALGVVGVAWAGIAGAAANVIVLALMLRKLGPLVHADERGSILKVMAALLAMIAIGWGVKSAIMVPEAGFLWSVLSLVIGAGIMGLAYLALTFLGGVSEARQAVGALRRLGVKLKLLPKPRSDA